MNGELLIENEKIGVIAKIKELENSEISVITPNINLKQRKKMIVSVLGISADPIKGVNGDDGKLGLFITILIGIKSLGDEPLKDIATLHTCINKSMKDIGYREGVSNTTQDETGLPVSFIEYKVKRYR